jgi:2-methylcitrate dehydratase PrpD
MLKTIASAVAKASWDDLSEEARRKLELCLLADLSVALAGRPYCRLPMPRSPGGKLFTFGNAGAADEAEAAYVNAATMHSRNQDDFHPEARLHVGTIAIPAALAVGENLDVTGERFLDGLAAGYAVGVGLARKFATAATLRGFRSTGVFGPLAATGAVARIGSAEPEVCANALALATSFAAGSGQCWLDGSDEWQLHAANASRAGVLAVALARSGTRGAAHAFDGPAGFYATVTGMRPTAQDLEGQCDASTALTESVVKRYSVSGINQSVVLVAERMVRRVRIDAARISRITLRLHPTDFDYPGTRNIGPFQSFSDAMMSGPFCCATVLARGRYQFADMHAFAEPERARLIRLTDLVPDPAVPAFGCSIAVEVDGRVFSEGTDDPAAALEVKLDEVDEWALPLWDEAGRSARDYHACRAVVQSLARRPLSDLVAALRG